MLKKELKKMENQKERIKKPFSPFGIEEILGIKSKSGQDEVSDVEQDEVSDVEQDEMPEERVIDEVLVEGRVWTLQEERGKGKMQEMAPEDIHEMVLEPVQEKVQEPVQQSSQQSLHGSPATINLPAIIHPPNTIAGIGSCSYRSSFPPFYQADFPYRCSSYASSPLPSLQGPTSKFYLLFDYKCFSNLLNIRIKLILPLYVHI